GYFPPGDRRICLSSGPFNFAPGDVQEVVAAILGGLGANQLGSVTDLKTTDDVAQQLFDGLFREVPKPPVSPNVTARPFEKSVVLEWGSNAARVAQIEETEVSGYVFEGYNVYQLPHGTATKDQAVRIATYDLDNGIKLIYENRTPGLYEGEQVSVPIIYGNDGGVQRYCIIDWDYVNNKPLYEGTTYYYAVTAYNQNHDEGRLAEKAMESSVVAMGVTLQEPLPGVGLNAEVESTIEVLHPVGASGGQVGVTVVDPFAITGHDYSISFHYNADSSAIVFDVTDVTDGVLLSSNNPQVSDLSEKGSAPVVDGVEVKVAGPPAGIKEVVQLDAPNGNVVDGNLFLSLNYTGDGSQPWHRAAGAPPFYLDNPIHELNGDWAAAAFDRFHSFGTSDFEVVFGDSSVAWSYANDVVLTEKVPFAVYKYNLDGTIRRLFPAVYDGMVAGTDGTWDNGTGEGYFGGEAFERIYAYDNSADGYKVADEAAYISANDIYAAPSSTGWGSPDNPYVYPQLNNLIIGMYTNPPVGPPANGTVIRFNTYKPIDLNDVFTFSTAGLDPTSSDSLLALAIEKINVFPNPYYAYNELATSPYDQYVTFTHLPAKATIKIFNLAGVLVRTIEHDNAASQFAKWDLLNASTIPVASGMYIAHINMPDAGKQKILKLMVIQSKQILEYY
ncbi:MAG: T9SS type A sorting domain-containing protein, partial [bacterium]|nr:T9SS type A sorting domain-containing protein [bacterium]